MTAFLGTDRERLALRVFVRLQRTAAAISHAVHQDLGAHGLSESQFGVLEALLHLGPRQQGELAARILRTTGNVTLVIDNLERRGLVRRERLATDRRCIQVHLTPAGHDLIAGIFPAHAARVVAALGTLDEEEQRELIRLCRRLAQEHQP
jgi:MarR family 2-MHQ and catechol resistance regulon transcriptional repressor